jgi:hypothetical protein
MDLAKGFKKGDLVVHIYTGNLGILLKVRPIDVLQLPSPGATHTIYDAYVVFNSEGPSWLPLEHIKKL